MKRVRIIFMAVIAISMLYPCQALGQYSNILDVLLAGAQVHYGGEAAFSQQYNQGINGQRYKHLALLGAGWDEIVKAQVLLYFDLDDYAGITEEGNESQQSWVTFWCTLNMAVLSASWPPFITAGWTRVPMGETEDGIGIDPSSPFSYSVLSSQAPIIGVKWFSYDANTNEFNPLPDNDPDTFTFSEEVSLFDGSITLIKGEIAKANLRYVLDIANLYSGNISAIIDAVEIAKNSLRAVIDYNESENLPELTSTM